MAGRLLVGKQSKCARGFCETLENPAYDFNPKDAEFVIGIIEKTFVHQKGEDMQELPA